MIELAAALLVQWMLEGGVHACVSRLVFWMPLVCLGWGKTQLYPGSSPQEAPAESAQNAHDAVALAVFMTRGGPSFIFRRGIKWYQGEGWSVVGIIPCGDFPESDNRAANKCPGTIKSSIVCPLATHRGPQSLICFNSTHVVGGVGCSTCGRAHKWRRCLLIGLAQHVDLWLEHRELLDPRIA